MFNNRAKNEVINLLQNMMTSFKISVISSAYLSITIGKISFLIFGLFLSLSNSIILSFNVYQNFLSSAGSAFHDF